MKCGYEKCNNEVALSWMNKERTFSICEDCAIKDFYRQVEEHKEKSRKSASKKFKQTNYDIIKRVKN